ncbi:hypothetical protein AX16_002882 [Volvariella volvacea WC 439]|nr:hypothetical protein AX16_002882 [Volvariella volvacea WC 439]
MAAIAHTSTTTATIHPPSHSSSRRHHKRGILLTSTVPNSPYISSEAPSPTSSSAASSSSSHTSLTNTPISSAPSSRRIRFAPLPDPRRLVIVNDDGTESPLPEDATHYPCPLFAPTLSEDFPDNQDTCSLSSSGSASKRNSFTADSAASTPGTMTPISTSPEDGLSFGMPLALTSSLTKKCAPSGSSRTKSLLFRPFSKKSSASSAASTYSLTPTTSHDQSSSQKSSSFSRKNISTEEILTLGTINLFRASSRDRDDSTSGWGLQRWTSAGSSKEPTPSWGAPLTRSQSSQSYKGRRSSFLSLPSPLSGSSSSKSRSKTRPAPSATPRHAGTRMLNGRIYGARRPNGLSQNPFANARDETDPEFVEWGYGGMGSVRNAGSSSMWNKVQSDGRGVVVGQQAGEEDDGSGMGWVRKRREERERARKEQEAKEKAEKEKEQQAAAEEAQPADASSTAPQEEHVLRAVNIPAPVPRPHHHHRSSSKTHVRAASGDLSALPAAEQQEEQKEASVVPEPTEDLEEEDSSSGSEDESESDSGLGDNKGDDEDDFEDDDDEDEDEDAKRKTSLCAGVEKIARHKEAASTAVEDKEGESKGSR